MKSTIVALAELHGLEHMLQKVTSEHRHCLVFTCRQKLIIIMTTVTTPQVPPAQRRGSAAAPAPGVSQCPVPGAVGWRGKRGLNSSTAAGVLSSTAGLGRESGLYVPACPCTPQQSLSRPLRACLLTLGSDSGVTAEFTPGECLLFQTSCSLHLSLLAVLLEKSGSEQIIRTGKQPRV